MINKGRCDQGFIWNPNICECVTSCDLGQYLDYKNCKCKKELISKSVEKCSENINGNELIYNATLNDHRKVWTSCTIYKVLLILFFLISISIVREFTYFHWYLKRSNNNINASVNTETVMY